MIAITGATGYVGHLLCNALARRGDAVCRLTRRPESARGDRFFALGEPVPPDALAGAATLIHAAHDFRPLRERELLRVNRDGTLRLLDAARTAGVARVLFVSSIASFAESRSAYGRVKWAIEQDVAARGGTSLRPGLVFGRERGGLFASLDRVVRHAPMLPDFGPAAGLYTVHAGDLTQIIEHWLDRGEGGGVVPAAHPARQTMRGVLEAMAEAVGARARFVPVPAGLVLSGLGILEAFGLVLPFRSDSLVSMLHANPSPNLTSEVLGVRLRPLDPGTLKE